MDINVSIPLEEALDLCWQTLAECFEPEQLLMKQELVDRYFPKDVKRSAAMQAAAAPEVPAEAAEMPEEGRNGAAATQ